jgi:hypothetical protein
MLPDHVVKMLAAALPDPKAVNVVRGIAGGVLCTKLFVAKRDGGRDAGGAPGRKPSGQSRRPDKNGNSQLCAVPAPSSTG